MRYRLVVRCLLSFSMNEHAFQRKAIEQERTLKLERWTGDSGQHISEITLPTITCHNCFYPFSAKLDS